MREGRVTKQIGAYPKLSEQIVADVFAKAGFDVEFIAESRRYKQGSADINMMGVVWEIKCVESDKMDKVRRNVNKAAKQSTNIIIGTFKTDILDEKIIKYAMKYVKNLKSVKRCKIVTKKHEILDIK